jgi:Arc/MetJ-type ribon-helix-helix transcriptional regulator
MEKKVTIKIPRLLYNKIKLLTADSGFNSPTDFIVFVLRDILGERKSSGSSGELTPEELKAMKQKLKNLGYL